MPVDPALASRRDVHDKVMALLKRRGFLQPSYEIYGGVAGFWDYGPYGAEVKRNLEQLWRSLFVYREGMGEIFAPTISPEAVFRASGHLEKFADTVVECPDCASGNRGDHLVRGEWKRISEESAPMFDRHKFGPEVAAAFLAKAEKLRDAADRDASPANIAAILRGESPLFGEGEGAFFRATQPTTHATARATAAGLFIVAKDGKTLSQSLVACPSCGKPLDAFRAKISAFNLMFRTQIGPGGGRAGYMRPETAQGMFMDFLWLYRHNRDSLPFGAVQLGKAYRNEISPRQGFLRLREFHQMEAEVFFDPKAKTWPRWHAMKSRVLPLLSRDSETVVRMPIGEAVRKGIVANEALGYFVGLTHEFLTEAGLRDEVLRFRQHLLTEKAHYATDTWDAEFYSPRFGWVEIVGIADRTDYDLRAHERVSGGELRAFRKFDNPVEVETIRIIPDPAKLGPRFKGRAGRILEAVKALRPETMEVPKVTVDVDGEVVELTPDLYRVERVRETHTGENFIPHVVEPSYGVDRIIYALFECAYEEGVREWPVLHLSPRIAPAKVGVFPLMPKDGLDALARKVDDDLRAAGILSYYDDTQSVGKRYARADEAGIPWCVTIDYETKDDQTVTVRSRETAEQSRVKVADLAATLRSWI
ncbi:MAG: glycine--tRNA ligase [Thermoplasmatota archaeon]